MRGERGAVLVHAHQACGLAAWAASRIDLVRKHADLLTDAVLQPEAQRKHLVTPAVGDDRSVPVHEAMQPAQLLDDVRARPQEQVVRIGQEHASAELPQLSWCDAFDAASGAD